MDGLTLRSAEAARWAASTLAVSSGIKVVGRGRSLRLHGRHTLQLTEGPPSNVSVKEGSLLEIVGAFDQAEADGFFTARLISEFAVDGVQPYSKSGLNLTIRFEGPASRSLSTQAHHDTVRVFDEVFGETLIAGGSIDRNEMARIFVRRIPPGAQLERLGINVLVEVGMIPLAAVESGDCKKGSKPLPK